MKRLWTIIGVRQVARSFEWYQSLLGQPESRPAHDDFGQILDADGSVLLGLHQWGAHEHPPLTSPDLASPGHGLVLFFRVDDFEATLQRARALVPRLDEEPHVNPSTHASEFSLRDPDGYCVTVSALPSPEAAPVAAGRNLAAINPFFIVRDLQASIAHYVDRLGFQLDFEGPDDDPYYGRVSRDGVGIMLKAIVPDVLPQPNHTRHEWARWDAFIYTLDPDPIFDELRQRGVSFVKELSFIDEGLWGFELTDLDGYVLAFARVRDE